MEPYGADALVFDVQQLLLRQLHVQEVLEHQSVGQHGVLQGKAENAVRKREKIT